MKVFVGKKRINLSCFPIIHEFQIITHRKKVNRKVQEEPQAEAAANPDTRRKRKSDTDLPVHS